MLFRHCENRSHAIGNQAFDRIAGFGHDTMLEEPLQAKHTYVVIPHEVGGNLEWIAGFLIDLVCNARRQAPLRKRLLGGGDRSGGLLIPLFAKPGGGHFDAHSHWPGPRPVEPQRIRYGEADQFSPARRGDIHGVCRHCGCGAATIPGALHRAGQTGAC